MGRLAWVVGMGMVISGCHDDCERWCGDWADTLDSCHDDCVASMEWNSGEFMCSENPAEGHWPGGFGAEVPCSKGEFVSECRMQWNKYLDELQTTDQRETALLSCTQMPGYDFDGDCCGALHCCPHSDDDDHEGDPVEICCGCLDSNECFENVPQDVSSVTNWCRGMVESGGEIAIDDACLASFCSTVCAGAL